MSERSWLVRAAVVLAGICLGQAILYGPALVGSKVLLPLDILTGRGVYLPSEAGPAEVDNPYLSDLVYVFEPARRFAHQELSAGRFPSWVPYQFAGTPFSSPRFSPFLLLQYCFESPIVIAWAQVAVALVAGFGAYAFCRRVLSLSFWPSAFAAWSYPLTGFFVFWQGYPTALPVCWLPWVFIAVERAIRGRRMVWAIALAPLTGLVLVSGSLDVAAQVLLVSGLFAVWCACGVYRERHELRALAPSSAQVVTAWVLGFLLAAPYVLPLVEYTQTGNRLARRGSGEEERPPVGLKALPQWVLPDIYGEFGIMKRGSFRYTLDSQQESTAAGYAGLAATLLLAPLAACDRRNRSTALFLALIALLGLSWSLNLPGVVQVMRLPGVNLLSHNRLVFGSALAVTCLAAIGLEVLRRGGRRQREAPHALPGRWMWVPVGVLVMLYSWCSYRALFLPEPIATELEAVVRQGKRAGWMADLESVRRVQSAFVRQFSIGAGLCGLALGGWLLVRFRPGWRPGIGPTASAVTLVELLWFAHGKSVQSEPALYYPAVAALQAVAHAEPGRVIGYQCLPANLAGSAGLNDARGYDAVDPAPPVELLGTVADPISVKHPYALTQWLSPMAKFTPEGQIRLPPILDLFGVRYVFYRGAPPPGVFSFFQGQDYWVALNTNALPRAYVPRRVAVLRDKTERLDAMSAAGFNPRETALIESAIDVPPDCRGAARLESETPTHVRLSADMETPGLLVLADQWNAGWEARVNGRVTPILVVDHAFRGVVLAKGSSEVEYRYRPASLRRGLALAGVTALILLTWAAIGAWGLRRRSTRAQLEA